MSGVKLLSTLIFRDANLAVAYRRGCRPVCRLWGSTRSYTNLIKVEPEKCTLVVIRAQERCESRGGRPGLPVPNSPYGLCGRKATLI